ncbi:MAG: 2-oxoglutarate dehydrogenase complex dihydrolipoyllysine-residue succinyltransferase [Bacteroidota bacterium]|nr:2-oxoglutarate dehydrogenase complex dihydrolipoyllysine-residue succinyltransferase [Bacteroidota bacterium]
MKNEIIKMMVPAVGESITEVTISSWLKKDGEIVELDEVIAEIDSDKATFDLTAESTGKLIIKAQEGDTLEIGAHICSIEEGDFQIIDTNDSKESDDKINKEQKKSEVVNEENIEDANSSNVTPVAKKIIEDKGIDIKNISGSGIGGKIIKEDVLNLNQESVDEKTESPSSQNRVKMTQLRKTIAKRLVSVKNETAMLTTFNEVDMSSIMELRSKYKESFKEKYGVNLGFMSFFTKACCIALKEWPAVNAMIDGDEIVYNENCNISIAVSTPKGLVVPVIRKAETMGFDNIENEVIRLATKARDGKLSIDEMQGGTFTITNGGIFGSMLSTPIINSPQSAILGMHNIVKRGVVINDELVIRPIMFVALSYDHRIIDGRESVSFLVRVKELLEDPSRLILEI